MNCRRVERLLSNHLEGRLPHRLEGAVARHLCECCSCRCLAEAIVTAEGELRCQVDPPPPAGIEARAVRLWMAEGALPHRRSGGRRLLPSPAAAGQSLGTGHRLSLQRWVLTAVLLLAILILEVPAAGGRGVDIVLTGRTALQCWTIETDHGMGSATVGFPRAWGIR